MIIRPYQSADESTVISLWKACNLLVPWNNPYQDIVRKQGTDAELFMVAELDSQVRATIMVGYDGHRGWINYLAVHPEYRRRGVAKQLLRGAESHLCQKGCPKLNLQIRSSNPDAVAFYQAMGYVEDDVVSFGKRLVADEPYDINEC